MRYVNCLDWTFALLPANSSACLIDLQTNIAPILKENCSFVCNVVRCIHSALWRDLDLSPSTLTDFLKGRLALSSGRISQISKKMGLTEEEKQHWIDLTTY